MTESVTLHDSAATPATGRESLSDLLDADWRRLHDYGKLEFRPRSLLSGFSPRFAPIALIRVAQRLHARGWTRLAKLFSLLNFILFGLEVPARLPIGPGLVMPHVQGSVLGAGAIGRDVTIYHQVTLGAALADYGYDPVLRPTVGDGAILTTGAKILGPVVIGEGAVIGANAVVLKDVPANATAVGVPARILERAAGGDQP